MTERNAFHHAQKRRTEEERREVELSLVKNYSVVIKPTTPSLKVSNFLLLNSLPLWSPCASNIVCSLQMFILCCFCHPINGNAMKREREGTFVTTSRYLNDLNYYLPTKFHRRIGSGHSLPGRFIYRTPRYLTIAQAVDGRVVERLRVTNARPTQDAPEQQQQQFEYIWPKEPRRRTRSLVRLFLLFLLLLLLLFLAFSSSSSPIDFLLLLLLLLQVQNCNGEGGTRKRRTLLKGRRKRTGRDGTERKAKEQQKVTEWQE